MEKIKTEEEYRKALTEVERLWDVQKETKVFEELVDSIVAYEEEVYGDILKEYAEGEN